MNLASRLQDMASPRDTLISDEVHRSVAELVACEPMEAVSIKGLAGAVRVWRVLGPRRVAIYCRGKAVWANRAAEEALRRVASRDRRQPALHAAPGPRRQVDRTRHRHSRRAVVVAVNRPAVCRARHNINGIPDYRLFMQQSL